MAFKPIACTSTTGAQFRAAYNASNYTNLTTDSSGDFTIAPTGGDTIVTGTLRTSGNAAIGQTTETFVGLTIGGTVGTATTLVGIVNKPTFPATTTVQGTGIQCRYGTAASAFTMAIGYALYVENAAKGAGSTITTNYGVYIEDQTSGATNWSLYCVGGNVSFRNTALATNATTGHLFIPTSAGAPTGVPASIPTGQVALQFDSTNNKLYVYDGGWISTAALT